MTAGIGMTRTAVGAYFYLCLSELPIQVAEPIIQQNKEELFRRLNRSKVMNSEPDRIIHPVISCVLRNTLARLPEYAYLKDRKPYINEKDGRLHFNTEEETISL